ncbi:integrin alpha-9-like, partial [Penaeus japonicus]|uniref:integrin alpha-9-like n=1 Tax=Penaeus japonicus TaxID=27405 RepID=UPI001C70FC67
MVGRGSFGPGEGHVFLECTMKVTQCFIIAVALTSLTSAFNLEPREAIILSDVTQGQDPGGRGSYFGFSVALHYLAHENNAWLVVGAPRANSSYYNPEQITEPGTIFKCNLRSRECEELFIDRVESLDQNSEFRYMESQEQRMAWRGVGLSRCTKRRQAVFHVGSSMGVRLHYVNRSVQSLCPQMEEPAVPRHLLLMNVNVIAQFVSPNAPTYKKLVAIYSS